ncbi:MAG: hypothetical protein JSR85_03285 [Proteobacteria bacterium]|nr:hypothetical protein [Pseudomonadota bacterium]
MKIIFSFLFISLFITESLSATSYKGSPDRCKKEDWSQVDTLLPARNEDGAYPQPMNKITEKIEKITPQQMLQSVVDHLLTFNDFCGQMYAGRGGFEDRIGTDLCERMAAYNMTHDGVITNEGGPKNSLFSAEDLTFLRSVFKACRPTTVRWWDYPLVVHVNFQPTKEELAQIRESLE